VTFEEWQLDWGSMDKTTMDYCKRAWIAAQGDMRERAARCLQEASRRCVSMVTAEIAVRNLPIE